MPCSRCCGLEQDFWGRWEVAWDSPVWGQVHHFLSYSPGKQVLPPHMMGGN